MPGSGVKNHVKMTERSGENGEMKKTGRVDARPECRTDSIGIEHALNLVGVIRFGQRQG
jgi:hypothetical protein